jgi:hypothetical protein
MGPVWDIDEALSVDRYARYRGRFEMSGVKPLFRWISPGRPDTRKQYGISPEI